MSVSAYLGRKRIFQIAKIALNRKKCEKSGLLLHLLFVSQCGFPSSDIIVSLKRTQVFDMTGYVFMGLELHSLQLSLFHNYQILILYNDNPEPVSIKA